MGLETALTVTRWPARQGSLFRGPVACHTHEFYESPKNFAAVMVWLRPATKAPRDHPSPPPGCGGAWKEPGKNWWVGVRAV